MASIKNVLDKKANEVKDFGGIFEILAKKSHVAIDPNAPLGRKSERPDILAKLVKLEEEIMAKARAQGLI